jgi:tetratricopeptide (TPR) repeat protein
MSFSFESLSNDNNDTFGISKNVHKQNDPHINLTVDKFIKVALQHKQENRVNLAIETLNNAMKIHTDAQLLAVRGSIYLELGKSKLALIDFEKGLNLAPNDTSLLINRAQVYREFGQISEALNDLNKAIDINPNLLAAFFNRGSIYFSSGDYQLALVDFEQCINLNPHASATYFNRATTLYLLGNTQLAIDDLTHFIKLNNNNEWNKIAQNLLDQYKNEINIQ